jgi:hypothetical protein
MTALRSRIAPRDLLVAMGIVAAAFAIRCWDLNARSLWFDEANEFWVASAPLGELWHAVQTGTGDPPLYSWLLHAWMAVSTSAIWIRLLSVIASVVGVAGVMALAARMGGRRAAFAAGAMMALLPADVRYAQEAGQYAIMMGVIGWNLFALHVLFGCPDRRGALAWAVSGLLACYAYYGAAFVVAIPFACALGEALVRRDRNRLRWFGIALAVFAAGMIPLAAFMLPAQLSRVVAATVSSAGDGNAAGIGPWFNQILAFQFTGWPYTRVPALLPVLASLALLGLAATRHPRVVVWFGATWLAHGIADAADLFPYGFRWGLMLAPALVALAGAGVAVPSRASWRWAAAGLCGVLLVSSILSLPNRSLRDALYRAKAWPWPETEDARGAIDYWREKRTATQATYVYYGAVPAFTYYTRDDAWTRGLRGPWVLDCWHDTGTEHCGDGNVRFGRWLRDMNPAQRLNDVFRAFNGPPEELWVMFSHLQLNDDRDLVADLVSSGYRIDAAYQATGSAVFLLRRTI